MKIKQGFLLRKVGGQQVVAATGAASRDFNGIIRLNETGAFMWEKLSGGCGEEELVSAVLSEYDVDGDTAAKDVGAFLEKLRGADLLE